MQSALCLIACLLALANVEAISIGSQMVREYPVFKGMPITVTDAKSKGWTSANGSCIPHLGIPYTATTDGRPSIPAPITLFFTPSGQITGMGVTIYGAVLSNLLQHGFYQQVSANEYFISVTFRNATEVCSSAASPYPLGDSLIVNAGALAFNIPTTNTNPAWIKGSCFRYMGYHAFYDLAGSLVNPAKMSFEASNLMPIVPMYANGTINAFFFTATTVQQTGFGNSNTWDLAALTVGEMCKNWCDSACKFPDTTKFSTMHVFIGDYHNVYCPNSCLIGCCPK